MKKNILWIPLIINAILSATCLAAIIVLGIFESKLGISEVAYNLIQGTLSLLCFGFVVLCTICLIE